MTRKVKKSILYATFAVSLSLCAAATTAGYNASAESVSSSITNVSQLLSYNSSDFSVTYDIIGNEKELSDGTKPFAKDTKSGVLLESNRKGAAAEGATFSFQREFVGLSEFDFRVFSEKSYDNLKEDGTAKADGGTGLWGLYSQNTELDLREIAYTFTDSETNVSFTVYVCGGQDWAAFAPCARVGYGTVGENSGRGLYYAHNAASSAVGTINGKNNTPLFGSSFCNTTLTGGKRSIEPLSYSTVIGFDPVTMQVYGYTYGIDSYQLNKRIILDLSNAEQASYAGAKETLSSFNEYTVSVTTTEMAAGATAKILLYSVNGQSLGGADGVLTDNAGASGNMRAQTKAVSGKSYALPQVYASDVIDGEISYNGDVTVKQGKNVLLANQAYQKGLSVTPNGVAPLEITLSNMKDGKGNVFTTRDGVPATLTKKIDVLEQVPQLTLTTKEIGSWLYERNAPVGATAYSDVYYYGTPDVALKISKNGEKIATLQNVQENTYYAFSQKGTYTLEYEATDVFGGKQTERREIFVLQNEIECTPEIQAKQRYYSRESISLSSSDVTLVDGKSGIVTDKTVKIYVKKATDDEYGVWKEERKGSIFDSVGEYVVRYVAEYTVNEKKETAVTERTIFVLDGTPPAMRIVGDFSGTKLLEETENSVKLKAKVGTIGIPKAVGTDDFDKNLSAVSVKLLNPDGSMQVLSVPCDINVSVSGTYTIVYNLTDTAGNTATKIYEIDVRKKWLNLSCPFKIPTDANTGESISFEGVSVIDFDGNSVAAEIGISVTCNGVKLDGNEKNITFNKVGKYVVTLTATADGEKVEENYEILVGDGNKPTITLMGDVPTSAKVGKRISLPKYECVDGEDGVLACCITAYFNGTSYEIYDYGFVPSETGSLTITYTATDSAGNTAVTEWTIDVTEAKASSGGCSGSLSSAFGIGVTGLLFAMHEIIKRRKKI